MVRLFDRIDGGFQCADGSGLELRQRDDFTCSSKRLAFYFRWYATRFSSPFGCRGIFYERQFITRGKTNRDVLTRFENLLDEYFESTLAEQDGLPTVKYFADKLCLSSNYFGDMFKKETGKSPQEYIQEKVIELAKERISGTADTVSQIAYSLGFQYPQHFCRLFKKRVGYTPSEYRAQIGLSTNL